MPTKVPKFILIFSLLVLLAVTTFLFIRDGYKNQIENYFLGSGNILSQFHKEDPVEGLVKSESANLPSKYAIYIKNLQNQKSYEVNSRQKFASASLYKLAVMWMTYEALEKGELSLGETLSENKSRIDAILEGIQNADETPMPKDTETIAMSVSEALRLMITISDNYSAVLLAERLGWKNIEGLMEKEGFSGFDLTSENAPQATATDVGQLLERIYLNQAVSRNSSEEMKNLLLAQKVNDRIPKYLPSDIKVAHKTGELDELRHDAGIVFGKKGIYVFVFLSDTEQPLEASETIAQLSKRIYAELEK